MPRPRARRSRTSRPPLDWRDRVVRLAGVRTTVLVAAGRGVVARADVFFAGGLPADTFFAAAPFAGAFFAGALFTG